jgi:hypothetical protein
MSSRQKYRFVVARYRPNQLRGEFVNVGIILHLPDTGVLYSRWLPNIERLRVISPDITLEQYHHFRQELARRYVHVQPTATVPSENNLTLAPVTATSPMLLDYLYKEWSVPFCFSEPTGGFTLDPQEEIDYLYNQVVAPLEETKSDGKVRETSLPKSRRLISRESKQKKLLGK